MAGRKVKSAIDLLKIALRYKKNNCIAPYN